MTHTPTDYSFNKALFLFACVYNIVTIYFLYQLHISPSMTLGYVFIFLLFWLVAAILLALVMWLGNVEVKTYNNTIALVFSSPIPVVLLFFMAGLPAYLVIVILPVAAFFSYIWNKKNTNP